MVVYWLIVVFILGTIVGSFLNVAIARLPWEKSLIWPGSRCGSCLQPVRWYDNIPLVSYLWLRGRCRSCGTTFSPQYLLVELFTGLGFAGLFYLEVVRNIHGWPSFPRSYGNFPWQHWVGFLSHALLFSLLLAASVCDLNSREIPLGITIPGTVIGLIASVLLPWPWPHPERAGVLKLADGPMTSPGGWFRPEQIPWIGRELPIPQGVAPWPVWGPLPDWLPPGSWQAGLATGLMGLVVGTLLLRVIGFVFSKGLGKEALGLGDADMMMMAGAFLGWQPIVAGFFISVFPGLIFGMINLIVRRDASLPFGPSLAMGVMIALLGWGSVGHYLRPLFFWGELLGGVVIIGLGILFLSSLLLWGLKRLVGQE